MSDPQTSHALIFANGDLNDGPAVRAALDHAPESRIIAADGGARRALACDRTPDLVIGDCDSLSADEVRDLESRGAQIVRFPAAKDETDLELALVRAAQDGATWLRIIGAVGDRLDQTLANFYLLTLDDLIGRDVRLVAGRQTLWLLRPGTHTLHGTPGDTLSLLPLSGATENIRTTGLQYPLRGETLRLGPARGVSNVFATETATITFSAGLLIAVQTEGRA
ncbi:MAG: thiamine diphosphokinase [Anaerolineae bacterium]|nr:thiamine diphosphokinase [Anaerolineae bacterium]